MAKYIYPAIFTKEENKKYSIKFPDLEGYYTYGDDLINGMETARSVLAQILRGYEKEEKTIPKPSTLEDFIVSNESFVNYVMCDTDVDLRAKNIGSLYCGGEMKYVSNKGNIYNVEFKKGEYMSGDRLYVGALCEKDGEYSVTDITANFPRIPLPEGNYAFLNVNRVNDSMKQLLKGKYRGTGLSHTSDGVTYPVIEFEDDFVQGLEPLYD